MPAQPFQVPTPRGPATVHLDQPPEPATLLVVLGHGAGGGVHAPDLVAVRDAVLGLGAAVARVEQPYRVAGRRSPPAGSHLDEAWIAVVRSLRRDQPGLPLVTGGRSSGARVACRTAAATGAAGVIALAFPLQPAARGGTVGASRAAELAGAGVPVLAVNGDRDPFGVPEPGGLVSVHVIPGADHSLRRHGAPAAAAVAAWLAALPLRSSGGRETIRAPRC